MAPQAIELRGQAKDPAGNSWNGFTVFIQWDWARRTSAGTGPNPPGKVAWGSVFLLLLDASRHLPATIRYRSIRYIRLSASTTVLASEIWPVYL